MTSPTTNDEWDRIFKTIGKAIGTDYESTIAAVGRTYNNPFHILISTIISLRTRDEVTLAASERLFAVADCASSVARLDENAIADLIYPAGFYHTKARQIRETCARIETDHAGQVPGTRSELTALPGVGPKTANLVLGIGFGIPAICVDTHVHRIPNRIGWIETKTVGKSETALEAIIPRKHWVPMNELLVGFGQTICKPVSPLCSTCPLSDNCRKTGVTHSR